MIKPKKKKSKSSCMFHSHQTQAFSICLMFLESEYSILCKIGLWIFKMVKYIKGMKLIKNLKSNYLLDKFKFIKII